MKFIFKKNYFFSILLFYFLFFLLFNFSISIYALEESEKKDVIIFGLYSNITGVPDSIIESLNASVNNSIVSMKRFNVFFYPQVKMDIKYLDEFIRRIKEIREQQYGEGTNSEFGTLVLNYQDMQKFSNAFYLIIPNLSNYSTWVQKENDKYIYYCKFEIAIKVLNVQTYQVIGSIVIEETKSSDKDIVDAENKCLSGIDSSISYEIASLDEFKLKAYVIKREGNFIYFGIGENLGVVGGHEFLVIKKTQIAGKIVEKIVGLVRVKEILDNVSVAFILYEDQKVEEGDLLKERVRVGFSGIDINGYLLTNKVDIKHNYYADGRSLNPVNFLIGGGLNIKNYIGYSQYISLEIDFLLYSLPVIMFNIGYGFSFFIPRSIISIEAQGSFISLNFEDKSNYYATTFGIKALFSYEFIINYSSSIIFKIGYLLSLPITNIKYKDEQGNIYNYNLTNPINLTSPFICVAYNLRF